MAIIMGVKNDIITILEKNRGDFISGQELAHHFGITRGGIWKVIAGLIDDGHRITAVRNRGYSLDSLSDVITPEAVLAMHDTGAPVIVLPEVDSTNSELRRRLGDTLAHGTLLIANHQTAGRGRQGKSFYSPRHTGLYMSVFLARPLPLDTGQHITIAAAVAVCRAIETLTGERPGIKWVNDIYLADRKVCGILTEAADSDFESRTINSCIVGIGVNCRTDDFPDDIAAHAGALPVPVVRAHLAALIHQHLLTYAESLDSPSVFKTLLDEYRARDYLAGRCITFQHRGVLRTGTAAGIRDDGNLIVNTSDETLYLHSGEVSIGAV